MGQAKIPRSFKNRPFSTQEAAKAGITFYCLKKMVTDGTLRKVGRGLYQTGDADYSEEESFAAASAQIGRPNAVCLVSALAHYHLTDAIPKKVWLMVEAAKRTQHRNIRLLRTRNPQWKIGIEKKKQYWITSIERTLVDAILFRNLIGTNIAMEALRRAIKGSVNLGRIADVAKELDVYHRVQPYLEALA